MGEHFDALRERLATIQNVNKASAVLGWDTQTYLPPGGVKDRGEQMATLASMAHEMFIAPEIGELLDRAQSETDPLGYDSDEASIVRVTRRDYDRQRKVPADLISRLRKHASESRAVWVKARQDNDFPAFAPHLQKTVTLSKELADAYGYESRPYDALLGISEPGISTADLDQIFASLRKEQVKLVHEVADRTQVDDSILWQPYDQGKQEGFGKKVVSSFGYSFERGRLDRTVHPFAISLAIDDVRITTRYSSNFLSMALFGTMHESGHAMYEQGIGRGLAGTPLARGASGGMHESQSRLWENLVGRSRPFWQHYYPQLQQTFPQQLGSVELDTFYRAINKVHPSLIRVEADEMTYNMHIMLRFQMENDMLEGRLSVKDAPEVWRTYMNEYLGVTPPDDTEGILQDIHWSGGLGGFPNYALGNVFGAQIWEKAIADKPEITEQTASGRFDTLLSWLQENVYRHGRKYEPKELIERVTGNPISTEPYIRYLKRKFGEIYGQLG